MATELTVTVTQVSPLLVIADGADTANPAALATGVTVQLDDRVRATLRTPKMPLVTGKEEAV